METSNQNRSHTTYTTDLSNGRDTSQKTKRRRAVNQVYHSTMETSNQNRSHTTYTTDLSNGRDTSQKTKRRRAVNQCNIISAIGRNVLNQEVSRQDITPRSQDRRRKHVILLTRHAIYGYFNKSNYNANGPFRCRRRKFVNFPWT
ncbi:hypothetical protein CAPTEDRAFT_204353 [Capitella teleta]|uniref:Uncharacterized protein n=1 Tax=Capitella teleta TaxID=283909 RepID=R7VAB0_CAPTE|nr:hypothetical protein CAPTEDRAFT_204353 [Capitella teleta]|eukprot:ELU15753.1 hypothetical protein CAPTEDRAFT_204353 [Capitella teleta]